MVAEIIVMIAVASWMLLIIIILIWQGQEMARSQKTRDDRIIRHIYYATNKCLEHGKGQTKKTEEGETGEDTGSEPTEGR